MDERDFRNNLPYGIGSMSFEGCRPHVRLLMCAVVDVDGRSARRNALLPEKMPSSIRHARLVSAGLVLHPGVDQTPAVGGLPTEL